MQLKQLLIKFLMQIIKYLIAVIVFVSFCLAFIFTTEAGLRLIWQMSSRFISGHIIIQNLQGDLLHGISWDKLYYDDETTELKINKTRLHWQLLPVLKAKTIPVSIDMAGADVHLTTAQNNQKTNLNNFKWLKYFIFNYVNMNQIVIYKNNHLVDTIYHLTISPNKNNFHHVEIESLFGKLSGDYALQFSPQVSGQLNLNGKIKNADIYISGSLNTQWNLNWKISIVHLEDFMQGTHGALMTTGQITGKRESLQLNGNVQGNNLQYQDLKIKYFYGTIHSSQFGNIINSQIKINELAIQQFMLPQVLIQTNGQLNKDNIVVNSNMILGADNIIKLHAVLPDSWDEKKNMSVRVAAQLKDLRVFKSWFSKIPRVRLMAGNLYGQSLISGPYQDLQVSNNIKLSNGKLFIRDANITLHSLLLNINHMNRDLNFRGSFFSAKGKGNVAGKIVLNETKKNVVSAHLSLQGKQLQAYHSKEYQIDVSPNLQLDYQNNHINLAGNIHVPYARIVPEDFSHVIGLPEDVVFVHQKNKTQEFFLNKMNLMLRIIADSPIHIDYKNFKGAVKGNVFIIQRPGSNLNATGQLTVIKGRYKAYGRELNIENGRLLYTNNLLMDPGLDIRAVTQIKSVPNEGSSYRSSEPLSADTSGVRTVGVMVRGTLQKPIATLFSSPPGLSQGDILSYILFGSPQSQISGANSLALFNMVSSIQGGMQSPDHSKQIQNKLGLTELSFGEREFITPDTTTQRATTVNIGKSLGPNLSIHYSVGLFENVSIFNLRYKINKYFTLQSETSSFENGGDILYQLESEK